jgi:hypothetical protein
MPRQLIGARPNRCRRTAIVFGEQLVDWHAEDRLVRQGCLQARRPQGPFVTRDFRPARSPQKERNVRLGQRATPPVSP